MDKAPVVIQKLEAAVQQLDSFMKSQGLDCTPSAVANLKGDAAKTLQGRVWSQWADNPDNELLFGIMYWNTGDPASGTPAGRSSTMMDVKPPDPLVTCCGWGFVGGTDKNNAYAGWYHAATTVRLAVKDKALMDQIIKAAQELVAMEVTLDGRTITGFKVLK